MFGLRGGVTKALSVRTLQITSQRLEEGEQLRRRLPFSRASRCEAGSLPERVQYFLFHLQIRRDVTAGGADGGVTKIVTNHRDIDPGLKKRDRTTVSKHVRGHSAKPR